MGHSDADVLAHAVADALLGAAALGDIGKLFPDTDERYKGADSLVLLGHVAARVRQAGFAVENIDATVLCQRPKLAAHIPAMREKLAAACGMDARRCLGEGHHRGGPWLYGRGPGHCRALCVPFAAHRRRAVKIWPRGAIFPFFRKENMIY